MLLSFSQASFAMTIEQAVWVRLAFNFGSMHLLWFLRLYPASVEVIALFFAGLINLLSGCVSFFVRLIVPLSSNLVPVTTVLLF